MASFKYRRIREAITDMIRKAKLQPGAKLPSEQELAARFDVNYHTVRKALALLVEEGRIERRVGSGTFLKISTNGPIKRRRDTRTGSSIGVLIQANYHVSATRFLEELHEAAEAVGKMLNLRTVKGFGPKAVEQIIELASQGCVAVIIPYLQSDTSIPELAHMVNSSPLEIVLPDLIPGFERNVCDAPEIFGSGDTVAVEKLCDYFLQLGYERLAFLGPDAPRNLALRRKTFAFSRFAGQQAVINTVGLVGPTFDDVDRMVSHWRDGRSPIGVICYDVAMALRLLTSLHRHDVSVPEDFAIAAMGESEDAVTADPPITTVDYNHRDAADAMVAHALALARGKTAQSQTGPRIGLAVRQSCGGVARAGRKLERILSKLHLDGGSCIEKAPKTTTAR